LAPPFLSREKVEYEIGFALIFPPVGIAPLKLHRHIRESIIDQFFDFA
jgi:hypothetical protein